MSASQFTIYSSSDANGPGVIFGAAGDLLRVLDLILVNGYTGKSAAGWTKPIANAGNIGCYKPGGGSQMNLLVNDNGANVTSTFKEAWITGWEVLSTIGSPVGTGTGQFPTPAQLLTTGHAVTRKSATADSTTGRQWIAFADLYTLYLFISCGDSVGMYNGILWFGDIYSLKNTTDSYRCMIVGQASENATGVGGATVNASDTIANFGVTTGNFPGHYMPRTFGGSGTSVQIFKMGDLGKTVVTSASSAMIGGVQSPNGPDNSFYVSPVWCAEFTAACVRGRFRGLYHIAHPLTTFVDGQTIQGSNDLAGKTIQIVTKGALSGFWGIETSNTVETN